MKGPKVRNSSNSSNKSLAIHVCPMYLNFIIENLNASGEITDEHIKSFGKEWNQHTVREKRINKLNHPKLWDSTECFFKLKLSDSCMPDVFKF